jgi:type IV pilus assembly protein PilC
LDLPLATVELRPPSPLPFTRVSARKRSIFYNQFARMLDAGLAPVRCLQTLGTQQISRRLSRAALDMAAHIQDGGALASALARHPNLFPANEVRIIEATERTGKVAEALLRLARSLDVVTRFWRKLATRFIYPVFLVIAADVFVPLLLAALFDLFGGPWKVLEVKATKYATLVGLYLVLLTAWRSLSAVSVIRAVLHGVLLGVPVFGKLARRLAMARFAEAFECLYAAGVPTPEAMARSATACGNAAIARRILRTVPMVQGGSPITEALTASGATSPLLLSMVAVGEESGKLEDSLRKVAEYEREDAEVAIERLAKILPYLVMLLVIFFLAYLVMQAWTGLLRIYQ